eukprot:1615036-Pleurochrysis_carterae.AAC.1
MHGRASHANACACLLLCGSSRLSCERSRAHVRTCARECHETSLRVPACTHGALAGVTRARASVEQRFRSGVAARGVACGVACGV